MADRREPLEVLTVEEDVLTVAVRSDVFYRVGDIKEVELPEEGSEVEKGDELITLVGEDDELHLRAPLNGIVLEVNDLFADEIEKKRDKDDASEWIVKIEPQDPDDLLAFEE